MKKALIILSILLTALFVSCNNEKITGLNMRIMELETQNRKLTDSINDIGLSRILNSNIYGLTNKLKFKVDEEIKVQFEFQSRVQLPKYKVYTSSEDGKLDKLVYDNMTGDRFEYSFTPKKRGEYPIKLWVVVNTNTVKYGEIKIPATSTIKVTE